MAPWTLEVRAQHGLTTHGQQRMALLMVALLLGTLLAAWIGGWRASRHLASSVRSLSELPGTPRLPVEIDEIRDARQLIDEAYAGPLRDHLGTFRSGSLFILDEAHHAAPSSGQKYAIDSQITRSVRDLAPRFEHRLFLSATPHNGHSNSFSALLEILDPIPVTHPHHELARQSFKKRIVAMIPHRRVTKLARPTGAHFAAQCFAGGLHSITNSQDRQPQFKDLWIDLRSTIRVDARRTT